MATSSIPIIDTKPAMNDFKGVLSINKKTTTVTSVGNFTAATADLGMSGDGVRTVSINEYKEAAQCLAEAFKEDHVARYFTHTSDNEDWSEEQRWKLHVEILEYVVYAHILKGLVLTTGEDYGCVALWMPPGQNMDDWLTMLRSGMWRLSYKLTTEGKARFFNEFLPKLHDTKHAALGVRDTESWYLVYIGTKSTARGKGLARKCIEHVTAKADSEGRVCYLESSNDVNPIIYRKLGFEVVDELVLERAEEPIRLDIMLREPLVRKDSLMEKNDAR